VESSQALRNERVPNPLTAAVADDEPGFAENLEVVTDGRLTLADRVDEVAAYIGAAYWFTSSTSFANPAIAIGRMFSDTFAGIAPSRSRRSWPRECSAGRSPTPLSERSTPASRKQRQPT
jgi:hypothetical protein